MPRQTLLALALLAALPLHAQQAPQATSPQATPPGSAPRHQDNAKDKHVKDLAGVVVTASALQDTADTLSKPTEVLSGARLDENRAATLGETVSSVPGVQSSNFGPGVGRPIIRGTDGPRVAILSGGLSSQDVSTVSQDHAPAIEPFLADQIEVLKGPSTLLYGSGAIGGAVNVVDGRIPDSPIDNGFSGRAETRFFGGDQGGNTTMARVDGGNDRFALHADAVYRHAPDYTTPDGRQQNSYIDTRSGALGGSLLGDWGYVGLSASRFNDEYGNPGEPGNPVLGERGVYLKMHQDRYEAKGALNDLWGAGNGLRFSLAHTGYEHTEFEGGQPGTIFRKNANEGRVEATFGSRDGWQGALGTQLSASTFLAIGEEAFVPQTSTRAYGVFGVARRSWDGFQLDLGARVDNVKSSPVDAASRDFRPLSLSLAGGWTLSDAWKLTLNLDRAERAPVEEELFSDGPHIATLAYEIGNAGLRKEAANQLELGLQYQADWVEAKVSAYYNRFDNFIYLADTGNTWYWEEGDQDLPVRQWTQANARFRGLEGEASFHLARNDSGDWDLRVFGDTVRATLANGGGNLPRIAPARLGAQLRWQHENWRAALGATRTSRQNDVAANETPTAGYTLVDAHLSRHFDSGNLSWELFADGSNLTNQVARVHTSFLKDQVMLPGRSVGFGVRVFF
ncbi:TonB-dependent receptor [Thermomonas haemolytica]|uniref:Iron complex outermembrane receptor protein n=1 Tax=Thermomonas haemolytica TaxID=141949 RepID=A0A4R3N365_9GAMM|nr:TonB-dependent receptor [Thermomonas haemolytica]TCT23568.1 iron complex outermembrane receptor protein [Thermomonas haemolytica]TNY28716.1 ligand-gated channel [Thermomonas haemolytica]